MHDIHIQMQIWYWNIKNNKVVTFIIIAVFLCVLPALGYVFSKGLVSNNAGVVYGYIIYITESIISVIGIMPLLLNLHGIYHYASGDCVVLTKKWNESKLFKVCYYGTGLLITCTMVLLLITYKKHIDTGTIIKDLIEFWVIIFVLFSFSHFLTKFINSVFAGLIITELYSIVCWFMGIGIETPFNIYSLELLSGFAWFTRILLYIVLGILLETITGKKEKVHLNI